MPELLLRRDGPIGTIVFSNPAKLNALMLQAEELLSVKLALGQLRGELREASASLAGWDVHHANLFDRVEDKTGIKPFGRLVEQVMTTEPYASARTVFWIVDNGSSHAGQTSIDRLESAYDNLRLIHLPIHASWLNQIELYFSIVQRKALTPNDFDSLNALAERLLRFGDHYRQIARPFHWTFTRAHLDRVLASINAHNRGRLAGSRLRHSCSAASAISRMNNVPSPAMMWNA